MYLQVELVYYLFHTITFSAGRPVLADEFLIWEKKSELERNNDLSMVGLRAAWLSALSTFSLPGISLCPGAQMKTIGIEAAAHVPKRMCIRGTRGWETIR